MSPSRSDNFTRNLKQDVVYWGNPVNDGYGGRTFADPVEMKVRWEDKHELFIDSSGQQKTSQAAVFVGEDVVVGGYLMLGTLSDLSSADESPLEIAGAYEIKAFSKIPDLKGESFVRNAWL